MLTRSFIVFACAAALAACGQPGDAPNAAVRVSDVACEVAGWDEEIDTASLPEIFFQGEESTGDVNEALVGVMVRAPEGSRCDVSDAGVLTCQLRGPVATYAVQDFVHYKIPEGRTATFTRSGPGATTCFLNEAS